jgi:hypothetical protein
MGAGAIWGAIAFIAGAIYRAVKRAVTSKKDEE